MFNKSLPGGRRFLLVLFEFLSETDQEKFDGEGEEVTRDSSEACQNNGFEDFPAFNLHQDNQCHANEGTDAL
ncbi:hypothetical protein [Chryseobacterium sp. MDT2-18]|uniref:hypothetical protein n=1 Tax=Chryseobacterium sp. MDT2-18 TaxID=1259136 RepID=UPI00278B57E2|nr:hypothetical protein [Chryseobacterium sp. MDT2-18]MDQ0478033.1 hypothetical protein [Chryseobacterium sp. MDT2-18]